MIDLTPLDVRNKRGDFKKLMRGYDPQEVDTFLEMVSDRLEEVVRENLRLLDQVLNLQKTVDSQTGRETAVQEALVSAQELRADIKSAAQRQAELIVAEAKVEARSLLSRADAQVRDQLHAAERRIELGSDTIEEMERRRTRFLKNFRQLLERELEDVEVEERKEPIDQRPIDLELGRAKEVDAEPETAEPAESAEADELEAAEETASVPRGKSSGADSYPSLDASVDELADSYRSDAERLFPEKKADAGTKPQDHPKEDPRWG